MRGEYLLSRNLLKGYIFEIIILELMKKNGFVLVNANNESRERVREVREGFIELKGRGCWHQIDCPCDYKRHIPFMYPLRLLGEVKFYKTPLEKKYIREYVGVIKDIQENYFVTDYMNERDFYSRKMEIGVYFSANGFQQEAEKLAYAHGIKTISYKNNHIINRIKNLVEELEENYLSVKCLKNNQWAVLRHELSNAISYGYVEECHYRDYWADGFRDIVMELHRELSIIRTSFIATTTTGVFLHFVSNDSFPIEVFTNTDIGRCRVYYEYDQFGERYFWIEIGGDYRKRKFYFTPPESLDYAAVFGGEIVLNEKERMFRVLNINVELEGVSRSLILEIDQDWMDEIRQEY